MTNSKSNGNFPRRSMALCRAANTPWRQYEQRKQEMIASGMSGRELETALQQTAARLEI